MSKRIIEDFDFGLTDDQKTKLSDAIMSILSKFGRVPSKNKDNPYFDDVSCSYFNGVVDGLNNAYKIVNGIDDDYNCDE